MRFRYLSLIAALALGASPALAGPPKRVPVAQGGTNLGSGTSGGVLGFTSSGVIASSGALTLNLPVIGGGAGALPGSGTVSGNTTEFATATGTLTSGHCVNIDANGNFKDAGGACTTGGGGGTVTSGLINQLAWYSSAGTVVVGLATADNGVLVTSAGGVPSISVTLPSGLTIPGATLSSPSLSGTVTGSGTIPNAVLVNASTTVNGQTCTLGSTCSITAAATSLSSATTIGGASSGELLFVNGTNLGFESAAALSIAFSQLTSLPMTLGGYGITNALSTSLANTDILVGNGSNLAAAVPVSGDATLANTGAMIVTKSNGSPFGTAAFDNTGTSGATIPVNSANNTSSGNNTHSGAETFTGTLRVTMRTVTAAGAVTVSATADYFVCVNKSAGAATTVNLPATPPTGLTYLIKDCRGDASTNNITITPAAGNVDGSSTYVISNNYGSVAVTYNGAAWSIN
jgi:hypothetical protein